MKVSYPLFYLLRVWRCLNENDPGAVLRLTRLLS